MNRPHAAVYRRNDAERRCSCCGEWLPIAKFYADGNGHRSKCRECFMADIVQRKRVNPFAALEMAWRITR
jgi:hypothetical protein